MRILAKLLALATFHDRYFPEIKWSDKSWTHNVFRAYEMIFGRRIGIRAEMSSKVADGRIIYACHSWESVFALTEQFVREFFKQGVTIPVKIWIPVLQTPQGIPVFASPYLFAIALNTSAKSTPGASPFSYTYTCTGSNLMLFSLHAMVGATQPTSVTYNLVGLSSTVSHAAGGGTVASSIFNLSGPATGSNSFVIIYTGSLINAYAGSYSGVDPTIDSTNSSTGSGTSYTPTTTVVASNCWLISHAAGSSNFGSTTISAPGVMRQVDTGDDGYADSNSTVGTGSQGITFNNPSQNWTGTIASFAPSTAVGPTNVKTWDGITQSTGIKTYIGVALASVKTVLGIS